MADEIDDLDKTEPAITYVLFEISVDDFSGENPTEEYLADYAADFAASMTNWVMTDRALITFKGIPLKNFVYYDTEEELNEAKGDHGYSAEIG
jgi:hypothetical protein